MNNYKLLASVLLIFLCSAVSTEILSSDDTIIVRAANPQRQARAVSESKGNNGATSSTHKEECGQVKVPLKNNYHTYLADLRRGMLGRKEAQRGEFPFIVALLMNYQGQLFYCGGSIISKRHIVTAASCLAFMDASDVSSLRIHVGDHDIYDSKEVEHLELRASHIAYHKEFDTKTMANNIGIVRLQEELNYTDAIQPICLSDGTENYDGGNTLAVVSGWGQLVHDPLVNLHKLDTRIWSNKECSRKYSKSFKMQISDDMICANSPVPATKNLCRGNGGSPLVIRRSGRYVAVGVTSWGIGSESFPCVFERIDKFLYWINRNRGNIS